MYKAYGLYSPWSDPLQHTPQYVNRQDRHSCRGMWSWLGCWRCEVGQVWLYGAHLLACWAPPSVMDVCPALSVCVACMCELSIHVWSLCARAMCGRGPMCCQRGHVICKRCHGCAHGKRGRGGGCSVHSNPLLTPCHDAWQADAVCLHTQWCSSASMSVYTSSACTMRVVC
jgi:hypothetical protein